MTRVPGSGHGPRPDRAGAACAEHEPHPALRGCGGYEAPSRRSGVTDGQGRNVASFPFLSHPPCSMEPPLRHLFFLLMLLGGPALHAESQLYQPSAQPPGAGRRGRSATGRRRQAPPCGIRTNPSWWCRGEGKRWIAIVGIPLKSQPAPHQVTTNDKPHLRLRGRQQALSGAASSSKHPSGSIRWPRTWPASTRNWPGRPWHHQTFQPHPAQQPAVRQTGPGALSSPFRLRRSSAARKTTPLRPRLRGRCQLFHQGTGRRQMI